MLSAIDFLCDYFSMPLPPPFRRLFHEADAIICARFTPMPPMISRLRRCRFSAFTPLPPRQLPPPPLLFHYFAAAAA
jgi:hypothetical protein